MHAAWRASDFATAETSALAVARLSQILFLESNPVPLKFALSLLGAMSAETRLPLCEASATTRQAIITGLRDLGIGPAFRTAPGLAPAA